MASDAEPRPEPLPERMRRDLRQARTDGDQAAVTALRTALAAMANAEAPALGPAASRPTPPGWQPDVARLDLSEADLEAVVVAEIADRRDTIELYVEHGRRPEADRLEAEIGVLNRYLS
jgi:uncharacterized protein YqeY